MDATPVGVFGLDNRRITKRNAGDPPGTTTISVQQVTQLYQFPGNLAAGQTIAIFSEGGYLPADISSNFSGSPPVVIDVSVDASNSGFADPETTQDIFIAGSAAPGAEIAVYFTTSSQQGWGDLIARVIHPNAGDPVCSVLSSSFYVSNGDDAATLSAAGISSAWLTAVTQAFEDAAIQGVTICIASGDTGTDSKVGDGGLMFNTQPAIHGFCPSEELLSATSVGPLLMNTPGLTISHLVASRETERPAAGSVIFFPSLGTRLMRESPYR